MALPLIVWGGIAAAGAVAALVARDRIVGDDSDTPAPAPNTAIGTARTINRAFPLVTTGLALYGGWRLYNEVLR